jgi:hypothetical protein
MLRLAVFVALGFASCTEAAPNEPELPTRSDATPNEPKLPTHIDAGTPDCASCEISSKRFGSDEPKWANKCALSQRYECPRGGTCGRTIECDATCCEDAPGKQATIASPPR